MPFLFVFLPAQYGLRMCFGAAQGVNAQQFDAASTRKRHRETNKSFWGSEGQPAYPEVYSILPRDAGVLTSLDTGLTSIRIIHKHHCEAAPRLNALASSQLFVWITVSFIPLADPIRPPVINMAY